MAATALFESRDEPLRVRDHEELRTLRRTRDQPAERGKELGVQARLRLVEHEELRRARREQRRDPQEVAQRAVGELGRLERAQEAVLAHLDLEAPFMVR